MNAGKRVRGRDDLIALLVLDHISCDRAALDIQNVRCVLFHIVDKAKRRVERAGFVQKQADSEIHFQEGKAHVHTLL